MVCHFGFTKFAIRNPKFLKVLHVIPSVSAGSGGPSEAIFPMCRALRELEVDVLLATTDADLNGEADGRLEVVDLYQGVPLIFFRKQWSKSFKYSRPFANWLDQNVSEYDLVHIHAVFNHACIAAARAARRSQVPYVIRPLGTLGPWAMNQKPLRKKLFWHGGVSNLLHGAAAVHYTSWEERQAAEASLGLNHGFVVPLGVETITKADSAYDSLKDAALFQPYILVLSRLLPTKGIDVLLDAFLALTAEFPEWRLVLAGDGPSEYVSSLRATAADKNATERVLFTGWLRGERKGSALRNASLLALPSYHENFGLCVLEAMACGVPVLVSPHVSLASEIEAQGAGWVVLVERRALQAALAKALGAEDERRRRGSAALNLAQKFSWREIAGQLHKLYASILVGSQS